MKHIPQRMCVACRKMYPQNELIRLVRDNKTGEIKFDCDKKLFPIGAVGNIYTDPKQIGRASCRERV